MVESKTPANPLFLRDEELRQGIELMFYAYRDFTFESDQQLKRYQLGRAHHRALYFIGRHPGHTVGHLLSILKVTKQSISRVLKDLLEQGYVEQKSGATAQFTVTGTAVYRVEVYLDSLPAPVRGQPWIISNPIYVGYAHEQP